MLQLLFEVLDGGGEDAAVLRELGERMTPLALTGSAIAVTVRRVQSTGCCCACDSPHWKRRPVSAMAPWCAIERSSRRRGAAGSGRPLCSRIRAHRAKARVSTITVRLGPRFGHLGDGDIIGLDPGSRRLRVLYRRASMHNAFLVTERCNHYCLMCSQPPRKVDDGWILDEIAECIELIDPATETIGFTGGEPLLEWQRFIALLAAARDRLPETVVHVLTNGRAFASDEVTSAWAAIEHKRLSAGIPLYRRGRRRARLRGPGARRVR